MLNKHLLTKVLTTVFIMSTFFRQQQAAKMQVLSADTLTVAWKLHDCVCRKLNHVSYESDVEVAKIQNDKHYFAVGSQHPTWVPYTDCTACV